MLISTQALHAILGMRSKASLDPEEMARELKITFFPHSNKNVNSKRAKVLIMLVAQVLPLMVIIRQLLTKHRQFGSYYRFWHFGEFRWAKFMTRKFVVNHQKESRCCPKEEVS